MNKMKIKLENSLMWNATIDESLLKLQLNSLAPIALFVYRRPDHTRRVLQALSENELSSSSLLYIFADGPKTDASEEEKNQIAEVRQIIRSKAWCGKIQIFEAQTNQGLADSIISGVTKVVECHGRIIVLEDDIVTSPFFLRYMNDALIRYANEERVMHVAGFMPSMDSHDKPEYFFLRNSSCWGWATWHRAWRNFHNDPTPYLAEFGPKDILRFNLDGTHNFWGQLQANRDGLLKTWAVFWYACVFSHNGLCLHPRESFVENIGFDNSGTHCKSGSYLSVKLVSKYRPNFPEIISEDTIAMVAYQSRGSVFGHGRAENFMSKQWRELKKAVQNMVLHVR
jgi:hypothetical protein